MRKDKFMGQINYSQGALTCSFNDYMLTEYIQNRRRTAGRLPVKRAVERVGPQGDGSWVLGPSLFFNRMGQLLEPEESMYVWLGDIYDGPGIAHHNSACPINLPLSIDPLKSLYLWAKENMGENFMPCMMVAGSCCMALHYKRILNKFLFCPVPIAYGKTSGTGKTTALCIGLSPLGVFPSRFVSKATYEKYADLCCASYLPLGIDDPKSKSAISDLVVSLFNGAKGATLKRGEQIPTSMAVISANFTTIAQEK